MWPGFSTTAVRLTAWCAMPCSCSCPVLSIEYNAAAVVAVTPVGQCGEVPEPQLCAQLHGATSAGQECTVSTALGSTALCSTVQHCKVKYSTAQYR
jgi:hypothetical protein